VRSWSEKTEIPAQRMLAWIEIGSSKFHDWKQRFGKVNEHNAWVPRDHWLLPAEKERIVAFARENPLEGYRRLTYMMLDADVVACSPTSVYRTLKAADLLAGHTPVPSKKGTGFVQPLGPHQHWHIDVSYLNIAGTFYFLCTILDGYSRSIVHWEIRPKMEESDVEIIVQRAREAHPGTAPRIISDNGPQFISREFKEFIRDAGMTHVKTSPYYPQSNGKIERWHKTLKGDCLRVLVPLSLEDARRLVTNFVQHYNTVRLHSAIGYLTPQDKLAGKAPEIHEARDRKLAEARERRRCQRQSLHARNQAAKDASAKCTDGKSPPRRPIDFVALRAAISIASVLQLLGFEKRSQRGPQQRGGCPLHRSQSARSRCFSVNLDDHVFQCFKCGRSGNALDLWAAATQQSPYDAALDLCARLNVPIPYLSTLKQTGTREEEPVSPPLAKAIMPVNL
jgi:transposase InsO family protein